MAARLLILSGPTREYLDPVRYISNASSGRQGIALAREASRRGFDVELVQGPIELEPPSGVAVFPVTSAREMLERALERHPVCDALIGAAAVSDYRPARYETTKHKRSLEPWTLELVPNPDILEELGRRKGKRLHIGFALESEDVLERSRRKLEAKNLDWIAVNAPEAIGAAGARYVLLGRSGEERELGERTKEELARVILDLIAV